MDTNGVALIGVAVRSVTIARHGRNARGVRARRTDALPRIGPCAGDRRPTLLSRILLAILLAKHGRPPRLCRGGSRSLTFKAVVDRETPKS
jgi:hypothetical protein